MARLAIRLFLVNLSKLKDSPHNQYLKKGWVLLQALMNVRMKLFVYYF